jgi:MFS superfamily sulfate permease-like transporter
VAALAAGGALVPAPLLAVGLASVATGVFELSVRRVEVRGLLDAVRPPGLADLGRLTEVGVIGTVLAFALIVSAESLFSAAAVDRLHRGPADRLRPGADRAGRRERCLQPPQGTARPR